MAITLNHTIVPAHDKEASAKFFAHMFGLKYEGAMSHFAPVRINETLTLDFDNWP
jgi:predicted enzyme related to lactoylglutathione lyase